MSIAPAPERTFAPAPSPADLDHSIHIWLLPRHDSASTAGKAQHDAWLGMLSTDELARAARFHFPRHSAAFVANRGRLRGILGDYLGIEPAKIQFTYGPMGKPGLPQAPEGISFNLSHTDGMAIVALTRRSRIGVDIEKQDRASDAIELARRFFSPAEQQSIEAPDERREQQAAFLRCWTRKEAFLKGLGDGLSRPLADFTVSSVTASPALLSCLWDPAAPHSWHLAQIDAGPGYVAALAYEGAPRDNLQTFSWAPRL